MRGAIPSLPNTPSWRGAQLKHRDNFTFTFALLHEAQIEVHHFLEKRKEKSHLTRSKFRLGPLACSDSEFDF
jgi:hypothetical protein